MMRARIEVTNGNDELSFDGGLVTIGGRNDCDVVLRDVMVADRHCVVTFEGGFVLRDVGSVAGTWVDGERAAPTMDLRDGQTIVVGTTRITVEIGDDDGAATLKLTTDPQSFWWTKPGKGAFDNDPDQLVYSEARFGRFPALRLGNRVAMIAGAALLLGATFVTAIMEPLADAGPLQPSHALVTTASVGDPGVHAGIERCVELAGEQGCAVCHTTGSGAPERKCAQCHGLDGEMAAAGSWRHPYHNDGTIADQQFCVRCHTDHRGTATRKATSDALVGDCAACHDDGTGSFDRDALVRSAELKVPPPVSASFVTFAFPHDRHLAQEIGCEVCHQVDAEVRSAHTAGLPDDPARHDFATVPYETCAACHQNGADAGPLSAADQQRWRAAAAEKDLVFDVDWHGTDDDGSHCRACHTQRDVDGAAVFGPELKTVQRPAYDPAAYRAERARYVAQRRSHDEQFAAHADGRTCTQCHLDGKVSAAASEAPAARPFWHGLHLRAGALAPGDAAGDVSNDREQGCVSCHGDLAGSGALTPFAQGAYHWPDDERAQQACATCHRDGERPLKLVSATPAPTVDARTVPDFPHDVHVGSDAFGAAGSSLAQGCFACHEFQDEPGGAPFSQVPVVKAGAADCTSCHTGHDDVGGGACRVCHPSIEGRTNAFLQQARVTMPAWPTRPWPAPNGFRHLSPGHEPELKDCATCHGQSGLDAAGTLADVRVPDEREALCRDCHLQRQFHWR